MKFRLTERADRDVYDIYFFGVKSFGERQADRYHSGLTDTFTLLSAHPLLGVERVEFTPSVRTHIYGVHLIVYRIDRAGIEIMRVMHASRDWRRHL